jgi:hypothetical protein
LYVLSPSATSDAPITRPADPPIVEAYAGPGCQPQAVQQQNIASDVCTFLPLQSAKVFFLEKTRANCQRKPPYLRRYEWVRGVADMMMKQSNSSSRTTALVHLPMSSPALLVAAWMFRRSTATRLSALKRRVRVVLRMEMLTGRLLERGIM